MTGITFPVLLAGLLGTVVGLILQAIGRAYFSRYKGDDTKEWLRLLASESLRFSVSPLELSLALPQRTSWRRKRMYSRRPG